MAQNGYPKEVDDLFEEADIASAIEASLEPSRANLPRTQDTWIPQSESDWKAYRHQQQLIERARADAFELQEAAKATETGRAEPRNMNTSQLQGRNVTQTLTDWWNYGEEKKFAEEGRAGISEDSPSEQDLATTAAYGGSERGRLEFLVKEKEAKKMDEDQRLYSEEIQQRNADQKASEFYSAERTAEASDTPSTPPNNAPSASTSCPRQTIDDRIKELQIDVTNELPRTDDRDGDTYIFIDPPAQQPEQTYQMYQIYVKRYEKPLVIRSTALRALHSPFFDKLLGPTAQHRTIRRRGLKGRLPDEIKYVIDLTPPSEGDDAAWLMTELCCVESVRNWHEGSSRWDISETLVGGEDEFIAQAVNGKFEPPTPEFSPIRHRTSIERVLNAIRDIDPKLDSAVKVYTTFAVARFFDITYSPLTDYIVRWLRAPPNSLFIEALPEIALKIGDGFQCHDLIRDAFAILVGEEALANLNGKSNQSFTVHGRQKIDVPESYRTRIEYSSKSFVDRVSHLFGILIEPEMRWMETLPQFQKLSNNKNEALSPLVKETKSAFKACVRGSIYSVLWSDLKAAPDFELGNERGDGTSLYPWTSQTEFWNMLNLVGRLMTTTFWSALRAFCNYGSFTLTTSLTSWPQFQYTWDPQLSDEKKESIIRRYGIPEIRYQYLDHLTLACRKGRSAYSWTSTGLVRPLKFQPNLHPTKTWPSDLGGEQVSPTATPSYATQILPWSCEANGIDIDLYEFRSEVENYIKSLCDKMLGPSDSDNRDEPMKQIMTPTLVCLEEIEWKYLPLYAGGLDDGSGGVFNDDVPMAEAGFATAGPGVHTGTGSSAASSDFEFVNVRELQSTHHTSTMTNDSFSDQLDHRKVYTDDGGLWDHIRNNKDFTGSSTGSHVDTATLAAPSTVGAESEDGIVLPLRPRDSGTDNRESAIDGPLPRLDDDEEAAPEKEDYGDIFIDSDDEENMDTDNVDLDDDDDDIATEKGEDDTSTVVGDEKGHGDSEDEDMVMV
ncbi:MAG: hypothetical protein Q9166_003291 [cf. Caloplaca sp. 2 TL-2023]